MCQAVGDESLRSWDPSVIPNPDVIRQKECVVLLTVVRGPPELPARPPPELAPPPRPYPIQDTRFKPCTIILACTVLPHLVGHRHRRHKQHRRQHLCLIAAATWHNDDHGAGDDEGVALQVVAVIVVAQVSVQIVCWRRRWQR